MSNVELTMEQKLEMMTAHAEAAEKWLESPERKQMQADYFRTVSPIYIENWPRDLCALSIPQVDIPLTLDEAGAVGSNIIEYGEAFGPVKPIEHIEARVNEAVATFPNGAFTRLGSRSPKDSWLAAREGSMKTVVGQNPLRFMLDCSERIYEDLTLAIQNEYPPHIFVRQWIDLNPWQEFRCFMRGRKLVGISQYYYRDVMPEIVENANSIEAAIKTWFEGCFRFTSHLDDVVFDIVINQRVLGVAREWHDWDIRLLEINPFFELTDPCMFDWRDGGSDFDGSFRFVGNNQTS